MLLVAACSSDSVPNVGVNPGGGGDGGVGVDSPVIGSRDAPGGTIPDGVATLSGRVCLASDPRKLSTAVASDACATTGADGLTVQLGDKSATTAADGTFTMLAPASLSGLVWQVSGTSIVTSHMLLGDYEIPALAKTTYDAMRTANTVAVGYGEAAIMITVIRNGAGFAGTTATSSPLGDYAAFYDPASGATWSRTATGAFGTAWLPNIDVGNVTATVDLVSAGNVKVSSAGQPLFDGGITFASVVFP